MFREVSKELIIKAIPTEFEGVILRSRLEPRWAAAFTELGWHWNYEPFDLDGWIPDFHLESRVLVEVKPFTFRDQWGPTCEKIVNAMESSQYSGEVLLLGTDIFPPVDGYNNPQLGWILTQQCGDWEVENAMLYAKDGLFDFSAENGRRSRLERVIVEKFQHYPPSPETVARIWGSACNSTKWSPK